MSNIAEDPDNWKEVSYNNEYVKWGLGTQVTGKLTSIAVTRDKLGLIRRQATMATPEGEKYFDLPPELEQILPSFLIGKEIRVHLTDIYGDYDEAHAIFKVYERKLQDFKSIEDLF